MVINYPFAVVATVYAGSFGYLYHRCRDHLPIHKYLSNRALWLAPLNFLFTFFTVGRQTPVFDTKFAPGLNKLKENYPLIRSEAKSPAGCRCLSSSSGAR
jgi:aspartyl/asparaginyl beta-hydroxylase (cupin superfamily)